MKFLVAILAILAVVYSQDAPLCSSEVNADDFQSFSLSSLQKEVGYYTYTDPETGKIYLWNTCGSLNDYCGANAAACISESGDLSTPDFTRAGSIDSFSYSVYAEEDNQRIEVTFSDGDWCEAYQTNRSITFVYSCDPYATEPQVTSLDTTDDCENVVLNINTVAACSMSDGGSEDIFNHYTRVYFRALMIFIWCSVGLFALLCCCACCALIRRRRCQRSGRCGYQRVTQQVELTQQPAQVSAKPTAPVLNQATQTVPQYPFAMNGMPLQYVPAPQYYYYMPQGQTPAQQQPPVVPLAEAQQDSQMEADEKLARELQAKFNHEV